MKYQPHVLLLLLLAVLSPISKADLTPESVAVVVNGNSWASLTIASEYVRLRDIPEGNVIVLDKISSFERMNIDTFRAEVLQPIFKTLAERGLLDQIDCITYSVDLPTSVNVGSDAKGTALPQVITPVASTNGLTYLHEWVMRQDTAYLQLDINRYSRRVLPLPTGESLSPEDAAEYRRGMALYAEKKFTEAVEVIEGLTGVNRSEPALYYNLACCQALIGKNDEAIVSLRQAVARGWRDHQHIKTDADLTSLRTRPDFKALLVKLQKQRIEIQPTVGFRSTKGWDEQGESSENGAHYMLSTMLGVTSGRGNSIAEVLECLRRAEAADSTAPNGTMYFLKNGNVRSTTREWAFTDAGAELEMLGVRALTENGILPQDKNDVAGAMIGTAKFNWDSSKSNILPGAIVEHLTSCGGMMRERDTQTPCTDFIRAGAAGSSGAVTEPYALQAKFPNAFMHLHYVRGSTLAEAFYQSIEGPYQLLILGDPLCQPWGEEHRIRVRGITQNGLRSGEFKITPQIVGSEILIHSYHLFVDGKYYQSAAPGRSFQLDTTEFADGEHEVSVVAQHHNALETRDRKSIPVRFKNTNRSIRLSSPKKMRTVFGTKISVEVIATGATSLEVTHLGRVVGNLIGTRGSIEIDTSTLGLGVATLQLIAKYQEHAPTDSLRGPSFTIEVTPPLVQTRVSRGAQTGPVGMRLKVQNEATAPLLDTYKQTWLTEAGINDGKTFELIGIFEEDEAGLLQIQLKTNTDARIEIDGKIVAEAHNNDWLFRPVRISAGSHQLRVTGTAPAGKNAKARLDLRLGITGTRHPSDRWLRQPLEDTRK